MNKYGGINDMPDGWCSYATNRRIYRLWYDMIRRCNDKTQLKRGKGRAYANCTISDEWMILSNFVRDVVQLPGYEQWATSSGMVLDKDILGGEAHEYNRYNCCFVPSSVNLAVMNKANPNITYAANESNKVMYMIDNGRESFVFDSEKTACQYLKVAKCSVASCYRRGAKCKGFTISRIDTTMDGSS